MKDRAIPFLLTSPVSSLVQKSKKMKSPTNAIDGNSGKADLRLAPSTSLLGAVDWLQLCRRVQQSHNSKQKTANDCWESR